jgi:hypothetical protein
VVSAASEVGGALRGWRMKPLSALAVVKVGNRYFGPMDMAKSMSLVKTAMMLGRLDAFVMAFWDDGESDSQHRSSKHKNKRVGNSK